MPAGFRGVTALVEAAAAIPLREVEVAGKPVAKYHRG